ncbi:MAG: APC family permease [Bacteroidales bacterium]
MLKREIRRWDLVLLMINSIIGAGIFGLPSSIFGLTGIYSIPALFACAFVVFIIALCFAEVASRFEKTGGPYLYTLKAFGEIPAVAIGWTLLVTRVTTYAAQINLLVSYLGYFNPVLASPGGKATAITVITIFLTIVTYRGVKSSTFVSNLLTVSKLIPLLLFVAVGLFFLKPELFELNQAPPPLPKFSGSVFILIFAFTGFESILVNTGEMQNPGKNIPFALMTAIFFVALLYGLIQVVCIGTLPDLAGSEFPLTAAARIFIGPAGATLVSVGAVVSIGGALSTVMFVGSRMPFAFSEEKQLPQLFSRLHAKFRTPVWSLLSFSVVALAVSLTGSFIYAAALSVAGKIFVLLAVCLAMIRFRRRDGEKTAPFMVRYGYAVAIVAILACIWLLSGSKPSEMLAVVITTVSGLAIVLVYKLAARKG